MSSIKFKQAKLIQSLKGFVRKPINLALVLALAGVVSVVGVVATPQEAVAASGCKFYGGKVRLSRDSRPILVAANWSKRVNGRGLAPFMYVPANKTSCYYKNFRDTDGFYVGSRCTAQKVALNRNGYVVGRYGSYRTGWHKISSATSVSLRYACW